MVYTVPPSLSLFVSLMYQHHVYMCKYLTKWRTSCLIFGSMLQIVCMYTCYVFIP